MTDRLTATDRKAETEIELILKTMGRAVCMSDPEIDGRELSKLLLAYRTLQYQLQAKEVEIDSLTGEVEQLKQMLVHYGGCKGERAVNDMFPTES